MSKKVRVLFAIGSMAGGGSERQIVGILKFLDRSRFVPLLYLLSRSGELLAEVPDDVPVVAYDDNRLSVRWNYPGRIHRLQAAHMARTIQELQVDVVYDRTFQMTLVSAAATARGGIPRISVVVADPKIDVERNAGRFRRLKRRRLQKAYQSAAWVVGNSEGVRQALICYYGLPAQKVVTLYNFLDIERIDRLALEKPIRFEADRFHIVCAGRLHPQKGYHHLIQAIDRLVHQQNRRELLLHIFGQGELQAELESAVAAAGLSDFVRFEGFHVNAFPSIKQAQLFCLPSIYEGMPNALIEAMALKVPVLATDCPSGPREILADKKDGCLMPLSVDENHGCLVPAGDVNALAAAIEDACTHYDKWQARIEPARAHVERIFSPTAGVARVESLIEEVVRR